MGGPRWALLKSNQNQLPRLSLSLDISILSFVWDLGSLDTEKFPIWHLTDEMRGGEGDKEEESRHGQDQCEQNKSESWDWTDWTGFCKYLENMMKNQPGISNSLVHISLKVDRWQLILLVHFKWWKNTEKGKWSCLATRFFKFIGNGGISPFKKFNSDAPHSLSLVSLFFLILYYHSRVQGTWIRILLFCHGWSWSSSCQLTPQHHKCCGERSLDHCIHFLASSMVHDPTLEPRFQNPKSMNNSQSLGRRNT